MSSIGMGGVGRVYDEYDIPIGNFLVDSNCGRHVAQYFFLHLPGDDNF